MSDDQLQEDIPGSIFRPSYSATFLGCPGSLLPSIGAVDTAGLDAAVGTVFHELMAEWQQFGRPDKRLGEIVRVFMNDKVTYFDVAIDEDMFSYGDVCLKRYDEYFAEGERFYETRVDISSITPIPKQGGTADLAICSIGYLDIIDWKYGRGVQVFAHKNTQLLLYAWGFFFQHDETYNFQTIRLHIAQPRLNHFDVWEITREELIEFSEWARGRMAAAWLPNADRQPSPKSCQWCKVQTSCPALELARQALADLSFNVLDEPMTHDMMVCAEPVARELPSPAELTTAQLSRIYSYRKLMEGWFKGIGEDLLARGLAGEDLVAWKVVTGRSRRAWNDEHEAAVRLAGLGIDDSLLWIAKLVSPNQAEPLLRAIGVQGKQTKEYLRLLAPAPVGKPTLVPSSDARGEIPQPFETEEGDL